MNGLRVGVISDTHGLLRPETRAFAAGCDYIIHGGDIGSAAILDELSALAPLTAVKGNNDRQAWAAHLPETDPFRGHESQGTNS
jgi:putative phosphoesterase